jgi:hypothetical protein
MHAPSATNPRKTATYDEMAKTMLGVVFGDTRGR